MSADHGTPDARGDEAAGWTCECGRKFPTEQHAIGHLTYTGTGPGGYSRCPCPLRDPCGDDEAIPRAAVDESKRQPFDSARVTRSPQGKDHGEIISHHPEGPDQIVSPARDGTAAVEARAILRDVARTRQSDAWGVVTTAAQRFLDEHPEFGVSGRTHDQATKEEER